MLYTTEQAQAETAQGLDNPTLSFNASTSVDYAPGLQFIDFMKMMRPWFARDAESNRMSTDDLRDGNYLDADGWVTHIPEGTDGVGTQWEWSKLPLGEQDMRGRYVIEYEGTGTIKLGSDAKIISQEPGRIVFENLEGRSVFLKITTTDPNGTGDYIRDISMVAEKNVALHEAGAIFNPDWIDLIKDLRELRFMDWMGTNNSEVTSWDDMPSADGPKTGSMIPIEYMVQLANEIGVDPWFNMPHLADEEYIRTFATYVRDNLDPALTARVEYSNEAWNWTFQQTAWLNQQSKAEWGVSDPRSYYVKQATEMALIWEDVFAGQNEDRLITVLGIQTAGTGSTTKTLSAPNWLKYEPNAYIDPKTVFDEVAGTTYFGGGLLNNSEFRAELLAVILDPAQDATAFMEAKLRDPSISQSVTSMLETVSNIADLVHDAGMKLTLYEGGQHLHVLMKELTSTPEELAIIDKFVAEFVRGDEMAELYRDIWAGWAEMGDGAFMQFADVAAPSKYGSWGLYSSLNDETPRSQALEELNATSTPWWDAKAGDQYQHGVTLTGTATDDLMIGTSQEDYLLGEDGDDTFIAGRGNDGINGGEGIDRLILKGAAEEYSLHVEGKGYRITGSDGSDFLVNVEQISFDDDRIIDLAGLARNSDGSVALPATVVTDPLATVAVVKDHIIDGTRYKDILDGSDGNDTLRGFGNHDTISGGKGIDSLYGGDGMDVLNGDDGNDILMGDRGQDKLFGGQGDDVLIGGHHRDILTGGEGGDRFVFSKGDGNDRIMDFTREDTIELRDYLGANQTLESAAYEVKGNLVISNGEDMVTFEDLHLSDLSWMAIDRVEIPANEKGSAPALVAPGTVFEDLIINGTGGNDVFYGGDGDDTIRGFGNHDTISGGKGVDSLYGGDGWDVLNGDAGDDVLMGDRGQDKLFGGQEDDILIGGHHGDILTGGEGGDRFVFSKGDGNDRVMDFTREDTIELRDYLDADQTPESVAYEVKGNLVISNGEDMITFEDLHLSDLSWMSIQI